MTNPRYLTLGIASLLLFQSCSSSDEWCKPDNLLLWYSSPASKWEEALPLGNGRIGAMVFGQPYEELYQLNEETLWSGGPQDWNNPKASTALAAVREAIDKGDYRKASEIWKANCQGPYTARYLPLADLKLNMMDQGPLDRYYRELNISDATSSVRYTVDGISYTRTAFISYPDQVMVVRIEADERDAVNFDVALSSQFRYSVKTDDNTLTLTGKAPVYVANRDYDPNQVVYDETGREGMNFEVKVAVRTDGGDVVPTDSTLRVSAANTATIILATATSYNGIDRLPGSQGVNPSVEVERHLKNALGKTYAQLLEDHTDDYCNLFDRVDLSLGAGQPNICDKPTIERLSCSKC